MADIMSWLDRPYLFAQDFDSSKDTVVEFERLEPGAVANKGGKKKMPFAYFKGYDKPLGLNPTNCRSIGKLFGHRDPVKLIGKRIALYVTITDTKDGMQECLRIRPVLPAEPKADPPKKESAPKPRDPNDTRPMDPGEAKLRASYGAELKALAATLQLTGAAIKERFGDLTQLTTEKLGEVCAQLNREVVK